MPVIVSEGCMRAIKIPTGFEPNEQSRLHIGVNWKTKFQATHRPEVTVTLFYRGQAINSDATTSFRSVLSGGSRILFSQIDNIADVLTVASLCEAMGNAGDNQLVNTETGYRGPCFLMDKAEVQDLNRRPVLVVNGRFRDENEAVLNVYRGIFIDANPAEEKCRVEEVFLHAPNDKLFNQYLPLFRQTVDSIEWR